MVSYISPSQHQAALLVPISQAAANVWETHNKNFFGKFTMKYQPCNIHVCVYVDRYIIGKPKRKFQKESLSIFPLKFNKRFFWWNSHLEIPSLFFRTKRTDRSLYSKRGHRLNFTDRPSPRRHCLTLTRNERNLKPNFGEFSRSVAIWSARVTHVHFSTKKTRTVNKKGLDSVISNTNTHTHKHLHF